MKARPRYFLKQRDIAVDSKLHRLIVPKNYDEVKPPEEMKILTS